MPIIPINELIEDQQSIQTDQTNIGQNSQQQTTISGISNQQPMQQPQVNQSTGSNVVSLDQLLAEQPKEDALTRVKNKSPLSFMERARLSFAGSNDDRERILKQKYHIVEMLPNGKFAVGNSVEEMRPIDPPGLFNDILGDLADVAGEIPVMAGQMIGTGLGAAAGAGAGLIGGAGVGAAPGAIAGGVAGSGIGSAIGGAVKEGLGKAFGVNTQNAQDMATDIALEGLFGAVGEGLGQAFKWAGKGLKPVAVKALDKVVQSDAVPGKALSTLAKIFKATSAVDEKDTIEAGLYGFNKTLNKEYSDPKKLRNIISTFAKDVVNHNDQLGKAVAEGKDWAVKNFGNRNVELRQVGSGLLDKLSAMDVGLIDASGKLTKSAFNEAGDYRAVNETLKLFFGNNPKTGEFIPKNLKLQELIAFRDRAAPRLKSYFNSDRVNPKVKVAMAEFFDGVREATENATLPKGVDPAVKGSLKNKYLNANRAYSAWKNDLNLLKDNGLDINDMSKLRSSVRGDDVINSKLESFAANLQNRMSSAQDAFKIITDQLPEKYPGKGINGALGTLYDELRKFNAAQGFASANPNLLRLGAVSGAFGLAGKASPLGPVGSGLMGLTFATPAGARALLKTGEKISVGTDPLRRLIKSGVYKVSQSKASPVILSRLIKKSNQK